MPKNMTMIASSAISGSARAIGRQEASMAENMAAAYLGPAGGLNW